MAFGMLFSTVLVYEVFETVVTAFSGTPQIALRISISEISSWSKLASKEIKSPFMFYLFCCGVYGATAF